MAESLAKRMPEIDELIFGVLGDSILIGSAEIKGVFKRGSREIILQDGAVVSLDISFDCHITPEVVNLHRGDPLVYDGVTYPFIRAYPEGGDETGLVILELGRPGAAL